MRRIHADEGGQSVVIVALAFTLLLGFAGLAIDGGRYYAERRFLQSAVDAAALGCTQKLIAGGNQVDAAAQGLTILSSYNLQNDPTGTGIVVSATPLYNAWFNALGALDKRNLYDGVYAGSTDCRVAVQASMRTLFIRLIGLQEISVPANAHASANGGMLPVVVNRYKDPPGPSTTFIDYSKQDAFQVANPSVCFENGGRVGGGTCPDPAGSPIECVTGCLWGPETVIIGQGYQSSDSDFRGFIALDVRDFSTVNESGLAVHAYYNGASEMNANQLKQQEASYVKGGYPGPDLVAYVPGSNPVQKGLQIATMAGNSAGVVVSNFQKYFRVGEKILVQLFDGQVREIPDFTINAPSTISANSPSGPANGPTFRVGANQRFRDALDWVDLAMARDTFNNGADNDTPAAFHDTDITFSADGFTPSGGSGTQVTIQSMTIDGGLATGIYSVIIKGTGHHQPVPTGTITNTKQAFVPLNVGGVTRDFEMNFDATTAEVALAETAVYTFTLTTGASSQAWGVSAVSVALDRGTCSVGNIALLSVGGSTVCGSATVSASPDYVPKKSGPPTVTVSVPTTGVAQGTYTLVVRSRGTNSDGQPVVHVQPLTLAVGTSSGGSTKYVNVQGYTVFIITSVDANSVKGRAISGYYADPKDPALNVAHKAGLIPWEAAPY